MNLWFVQNLTNWNGWFKSWKPFFAAERLGRSSATNSVGSRSFPGTRLFYQLLENADVALYQSKQRKRAYTFYTKEYHRLSRPSAAGAPGGEISSAGDGTDSLERLPFYKNDTMAERQSLCRRERSEGLRRKEEDCVEKAVFFPAAGRCNE